MLDQIVIAADKAMYASKAVRKERNKRVAESPAREIFIVELDESHIISSSAIN